jgi:pyocin large subunit-like protein
MKVEVKDYYKKGKMKGRKKYMEGNFPESQVDTLDYVPRSVRIKNALMAGEKLRAFRADENSSDDIAPDYKRNYDLVDAAADKSIADANIAKKLKAKAEEDAKKAEAEFNARVEEEIVKRANDVVRTDSEPTE